MTKKDVKDEKQKSKVKIPVQAEPKDPQQRDPVPAPAVQEPQQPTPPTAEERLIRLEGVVAKQQEFLEKIAAALTKEAQTPLPEQPQQMPQQQQTAPKAGGGIMDLITGIVTQPGMLKQLMGGETAGLDPLSQSLLDMQKRAFLTWQNQQLKRFGKLVGIEGDHVSVTHG